MTAISKYNLTTSDGTTQQYALGTEINVKGATWKYILAKGILAVYDMAIGIATNTGEFGVVSYSGTYPALNVVSEIVVPQFAFADAEYGWAPVGPFGPFREDGSTTFKVTTLTLCVLNVILYTSATAGACDDTSSTQVQIQGLRIHATTGAGTTSAACSATKRLTVNS